MLDRFITLTVINTYLKDEVLDEINYDVEEDEILDENGRNKEYYIEELGIPESKLPDIFRKKRKSKTQSEVDKKLNDPGSYEYVARDGKFDPLEIKFMIDGEDFGCRLYMKEGYTADIEETVNQVDRKIKALNRKNKKDE